MKTNIYAPVIASVENASVDARVRYGIKHSTTLDQTVNFQNMADDLAGNNGARKIILPHGEFHIDGNVDFHIAAEWAQYPADASASSGIAGLSLFGQGIGATHIVQEGVGVPTFSVSEAGVGRQHNYLRMGGFSMIGPGFADTGTIGIQLGGVSADASDIIAGAELAHINIRNFSTAYAFDDCTNLNLHKVQCEGYMYGMEFGFNVDIVSALQCRFNSPSIPVNKTGDITSGSDTITNVTDTTDMTTGMRIVSSLFPRGSMVISFTASTITFDTNATGTGVGSTFDFVIGISLSYGAGPFVGNWPGAGTGNGNAHNYKGCTWAKNYECINIADSPAVSNVKFDTCYTERVARIATIDNGESIGAKYLQFDNCHFAVPSTLQVAAIYENLATSGAGTTIVKNCRSDLESPVPWIRLDSSASRLDWDNNELRVSAGNVIEVFDSFNGFNPAVGDKFMTGIVGNNAALIDFTLANPKPTAVTNCTLKKALTTAFTVNDVDGGVLNNIVEGQRVGFWFEQDITGGRNVTWNATYKFHTAWTNTGNTSGTFSYVEFMYNGADFMQISPANYWV